MNYDSSQDKPILKGKNEIRSRKMNPCNAEGSPPAGYFTRMKGRGYSIISGLR